MTRVDRGTSERRLLKASRKSTAELTPKTAARRSVAAVTDNMTGEIYITTACMHFLLPVKPKRITSLAGRARRDLFTS